MTNDISQNFTDLNFRKAITDWLGFLEGSSFTRKDLLFRIMNWNDQILDIRNKNISSLSGLEYFEDKDLMVLDCSNNRLTQLPELPKSLEAFSCSNNMLAELPDLPQEIRILNCSNNRLKQLPKLPTKLISLDCSNNPLIKLPELPARLRYLACSENLLSQLPEQPLNLEIMKNISQDFTDLNFRQTITDWLGIPEGSSFTKQDLIMKIMKSDYPILLDISNNNISSVAGLEHFKERSLVLLNYSDDQLIQLSELQTSLGFLLVQLPS